MNVPKEIKKLVERFRENRDVYCSSAYNETQARREFIDLLFKALGWDVANEKGYAEAYKEVIHEDAIKVGGATKAPDYAFRIGGVRKFFVEAKRPGLNIKQDGDAAYQLRRYAWSAKLPLSILTDFEEFAVYDCRIKPVKTDKASTGRVLYLTADEYAEQWDEISSIFSQDAILTGSFDRYAESTKRKKGTAEVDKAFLKEIEDWRDVLARNIALRNTQLSTRELNFAVQRTIDRLIFLRICEDRGIETYGQLMAFQNGTQIYKRLCEIFRRADERYNSGMFHFKREKDRPEPPDGLTLNLTIDDKALKGILKELYYPESPYEFSVLPADILGQVYEQFLGKVIRLTAGHHAKVEDKPEVKKAGGVYYTSTYIVDYIVEHTVGKLLDGKTPNQVAKLRVLDPACGSGSFLLGAYQKLLDWHLRCYSENNPEKHAKGKNPKLYRTISPSPTGRGQSEGTWRLTTAEKKRILLNTIYGVDIDPQAVEVTKLSLLLKVLEGENEETIGQSLRLFHERALPDLSDNIKCGNSLIGPDFYEGKQLSLIDEEQRYRINAFDWHAEFPHIFSSPSGRGQGEGSGFDAVIGNPPYIRIQAMKEWAPIEVDFYKQRYSAASKGNYDIYVVFVERALQLLNKEGRMGFILPHKFFQAKYGEPLRGLLAEGRHLGEVVHFGDQQVFAGASTYTCLLFLDKRGNESFRYVKAHDLDAWRANGEAIEGEIRTDKVTGKEWNFVVGPGATLFGRLSEMPVRLADVTSRIFQGIKTSADKIYIVDEREREAKRVRVFSRARDAEYWLEPDLLHPLIKGGDSRRYHLSRTNRLILFPYATQEDGGTGLIPESIFKRLYPLTWTYLTDNKRYLENRERGRMRGAHWYGYGRNQALDVVAFPKLFTPDIATCSSFSLDGTGEIFFTGGVAGGYGILVSPEYSREYMLGLLNSRLLEWFIQHIATQMRGGYFSYESRFIRNLPVRTIDFSDSIDKTRHDRMVELVNSMLNLHRDLQAAKTDHEKSLIQRQIDTTDKQIDQLVYEFYGLTDEEIRIVEEATE